MGTALDVFVWGQLLKMLNKNSLVVNWKLCKTRLDLEVNDNHGYSR